MATQQPASSAGTVFCRHCGKAIEADARFCRFCGKSQADRPEIGSPAASTAGSATAANRPAGNRPAAARQAGGPADGLENWLRQLFPRHHLQDEFTHIGTIAAFLMALIGFVLGFFIALSWLGTNFLLGSVALLLFLILRESTLSHIRVRGSDAGSSPEGGRYHAARREPAVAHREASSASLPPEAATTQSSPPVAGRPKGPAA